MEEILASIRKIIAEDSTGLRTPSAPQRSGTSYPATPKTTATPQASPAGMPQRGFMSREAFLKSSPSSEPEPRRDISTPGDISRAPGREAAGSAASSRLPRRDETPVFSKSSPFHREADVAPSKDRSRSHDEIGLNDSFSLQPAKEQPRPAKNDAVTSSHPATAREQAKRSPADSSDPIETVEVVALEDVLPVVSAGAAEKPAAKDEGNGASKPAPKADVASIEAQLTELLSDDLNALRQGRSGAQEDSIAKNEKAPSELENNDPFAFDLGPSPFAPKVEAELHQSLSRDPQPAPRLEPAKEPTSAGASKRDVEPSTNRSSELGGSAAKLAPEPPAASAQKPAAAIVPEAPRSYAPSISTEPSIAERPAPSNGSHFVPFASPSAPAEPFTPASVPQSDPAPSKGREAFVVPSVSATLGPTRKLEPLSNAFRPVAPPTPKPLENFAPEPEKAPELPQIVTQYRGAPQTAASTTQHSARAQDESGSPSNLPAMASESALDRPMEDAMADLLRPLLKTWLAENMPKIVERALRREMSERLLPGQKSPRE
jgi:cell pole-organizing protein PopZ